MSSYDKIPSGATLDLKAFKAEVPEEELKHFKELLRLSKIGPKVYENQREDGTWGVSHDWMVKAKKYWEEKFDWREHEKYINSFPNYTTQIKDDDGAEFTIHFVALFSEKPDAIPLLLLHGWPGSFLEFLGFLDIFKKKYSPQDLPYHLIVPSLPGAAYSSNAPMDKEFQYDDLGRVMNKLMVGLGFGSGYAVQGGDIGSYISRVLCSTYDACKVMHLNFNIMRKPESISEDSYTAAEEANLKRFHTFSTTGIAYAMEQGTRTATIGFVLASSPLALLAWIGEKFLEWTDDQPSLDHILESITLYWFTETFPRWIYPYRAAYAKGAARYMLHEDPKYHVTKPFGYSGFPKEIANVPRSWIETTGNLVWYRQHDKGGHFAVMEQPQAAADDLEQFLAQVWPGKN